MIEIAGQTAQTLAPIDMEPRAAQPLAVQQQSAIAAPRSRDDMFMEAMSRGYTPEQIGQMMDLRDRHEAREAEKAFRLDFAAFRGENIIVPKTMRVDRGKAGSFDQAEFHVIGRMLSPALAKYGFGFRHDQKFTSRPWTTDGVVSDVPWVIVTCFLEHRDGFREVLTLEGPPGDLAANTPVQNMQVTGSYLKRQSLLALTGTATGGEDDENRMRGSRSGGAASDAGGADDEELIDAGRAASMEGLKPLTAWWASLTAQQRKRLDKEFGAMRKAARHVEDGNAP